MQIAGDYQSVAAVVAWADQNQHSAGRLPRLHVAQDGSRDGPAGQLHHRCVAVAVRVRCLLDLHHFGDGDDLHDGWW